MNSQHNTTIWVIDDDIAILDATEAVLVEEGYRVVTIHDPVNIGAYIRQNTPPHLIFLDILMSGADGREVAHYLRSRPSIQQVPIVMLSANLRIEEIARQCGVDGYLKKPFDIDDLLATVQRHLPLRLD